MKALVTGGAGLIGSHIVDQLLAKGYSVKVIDNLEQETHQKGKPEWIPKEVEFIHGNTADPVAMLKAMDGVDVIFHQAAYGGFALDQNKYVHSNTLGTTNMFSLIKQHKLPIKKVVYASSQAVYGEGKYYCSEHGVQEPHFRGQEQSQAGRWEMECAQCGHPMIPLPTDENKKLCLDTMYAITKYSQELVAKAMGKSLGIPTVGLRYSITYGPRQSLYNPYTGICSIFSTMILNDIAPTVYEDGRQTRDFVFVEDVAKANIVVMENDKANNEVFNVGTGKQTSVIDFVRHLSDAYGKEAKYNFTQEFRPCDVRHLYSDNRKLAKLGFKPQVSLQEGIKKYANWIKTQGQIEEYFSKYKEKMLQMGIVKKKQ